MLKTFPFKSPKRFNTAYTIVSSMQNDLQLKNRKVCTVA